LLKNNKDPWFDFLLKNRYIVILPMTNPYGYHKSEREELLAKNEDEFLLLTDNYSKSHKDINRDFPYLVDKEHCFETIGARVINELYLNHIFVISLSLHGGTESLTYPYGTPNHIFGTKYKKVEMDYKQYNTTTPYVDAIPTKEAEKTAEYYRKNNFEHVQGKSTEAPDEQAFIGNIP
jgi:hypothetical protein